MPIIRNLRKDFEEGRMDDLRSLTFEERGTKSPYVTKPEGASYDEASKRRDDVTRISKLLIDKPGVTHLAKEALLKQIEITRKLEGNNGTTFGNIIRRTGGTIKHIAQVTASTLAQVPVNGTGTHFLRALRTDTYLQDNVPTSGFANLFGVGGIEGSAFALKGQPIPLRGLISNSEVPNNTTATEGNIGENHIGIKGKLTSVTDISAYTKKLTYYSSEGEFKPSSFHITGDKSIGIVFPKINSEFIQTATIPGQIGVDKSATGAISEFAGKLNSNPSLITNTYNPNADKEFLGSKTEKNQQLSQRGFPINPGLTVEGFTLGNAAPQDLFIPTSFTTAASGSFGITNKITGSSAGIAPALIEPFKLTEKKSKLSTEENILAVSSTGRIPLDKVGLETTNEILLSQPNDFDSGDITSAVGLSFDTFTEQNPFSGTSTLNSIIAAQNGQAISIKLQAGNSPNETTSTIVGSTTNRGTTGEITGITDIEGNKYSDSSSYNKTLTLDNILAAQKGNLIPSFRNTGVDPISKTSIDPSQPIVGVINGENVSSLDSSKSKTALQDFRAQGQPDPKGSTIPEATDKISKQSYTGTDRKTTYAFDYNSTTVNKENRVGLGNPGKISRSRISYFDNDPETVDKINALPVSLTPLDGVEENRDLIQLEFQVITPDKTFYLAFRAFLDTFDDSFNASWGNTQYLGRADNFYTYTGFERTINIGFKIAAQSREEMQPLYEKAATLASVTAPSYGSGGRFMRGTIAKVTVGDYIYEQPGIIESVQYTWQKDYPWEISFQNPEIGDGKGDQILPHVLDVTLSFKVIHDFLPEAGKTPFITNYNPKKENKKVYIPLENKELAVAETADQNQAADSSGA